MDTQSLLPNRATFFEIKMFNRANNGEELFSSNEKKCKLLRLYVSFFHGMMAKGQIVTSSSDPVCYYIHSEGPKNKTPEHKKTKAGKKGKRKTGYLK